MRGQGGVQLQKNIPLTQGDDHCSVTERVAVMEK